MIYSSPHKTPTKKKKAKHNLTLPEQGQTDCTNHKKKDNKLYKPLTSHLASSHKATKKNNKKNEPPPETRQ